MSSGRWRSLVGSRWSLSLRAWLFVAPAGVIAAPLAAIPGSEQPDRIGYWLLLGLIAQLPMGIVMGMGGWLASRASAARTAVVVTTLCAGAARGLAIAVLGRTPDVFERTLASAVTMSIWLLVIGAAIESHERFVRERDELLAALVARELHGRLLDDAVTDAARSAAAPRIAEASGELRAIIEGAADDHVLTAALLQASIENRLRPLSHDLWFSPRPTAPQAHRRTDLLRAILTADVPVRPLAAAALLLITWGSWVLHGVWQGALVGIAVAAGYSLVLIAAHAAHHRRSLGAVIRYLGSALVPAAAGGAVIGALGLSEASSTLAVAIGLPVITGCVAAAITLGADRAATLADLRARVAEPDWDRHLGELVRREVEAHTATTLHNAVQPALTAAALQLRLAAALDEPSRARVALTRAVHALDAAEHAAQPSTCSRDRLHRVAEAWSGIAEVEIHIDDGPLSARESELIADVVEESVANAVRHGRASSIQAQIDTDPRCITITVVDNGIAEHPNRADGLGRTWLNSMMDGSSMWVRSDGRNVRRMEFPRTQAATGRG